MEEGRKAVEEHGAKCIAIKCDVTKEDEVEAPIAKTTKTFGRIDFAANFAGVAGPLSSIEDTEFNEFEKVLKVNPIGVFLCAKHQIRQMSKQEPVSQPGYPVPQRGSIVNCASVNSIISGPTSGGYTTSKHAVVGITKAASLEARAKHIRVNSLSPGFIYTDMVSQGFQQNKDPRVKQAWAQFESRQGRKAFSREIGDATVLLSSVKMSLVNAHNLVCDNGFIMSEYS